MTLQQQVDEINEKHSFREVIAWHDPYAGPFDVPLISRVLGHLWVGGCVDGVRLPNGFNAVVSLYSWERYNIPSSATHVTFEMVDGPDMLPAADLCRIAEYVRSSVKQCRNTLVHCQAGLNRSGLVAAFVLVLDGYTPDEAINLLRERRSPMVLCNQTFESWLRQRATPLKEIIT